MSKKIDLTGQRFGRLIVLCEDGRTNGSMVKWKCQCDCGDIVSVSGNDLRSGKTKSCGCLCREILKRRNEAVKVDYTGKRFGRLVVRCRDETCKKIPKWVCMCDCGNVVSVRGQHLRRGQVISCGCYNREQASARFSKHRLTCTHPRLYASIVNHYIDIKKKRSSYGDWRLDRRYPNTPEGRVAFVKDVIQSQPLMCWLYERDSSLDLDKDSSMDKVFRPECITFRNYVENRGHLRGR